LGESYLKLELMVDDIGVKEEVVLAKLISGYYELVLI